MMYAVLLLQYAVGAKGIRLSTDCVLACKHLAVGVKIVLLAVNGLPAGLGVKVTGRQIVGLSIDGLPAFQKIALVRTQIIPFLLFFDPLPAGVHIAGDRIKIVLLVVDALPAKVHLAVACEVILVALDGLPACHTQSVSVEIVDIAVDILEAVRQEGIANLELVAAAGFYPNAAGGRVVGGTVVAGKAAEVHDLSGRLGRVTDNNAFSGRAFNDFAIAQIDCYMTVAAGGSFASADHVAGRRLADVRTDVDAAGIAAWLVAPLVGVDEVLDQSKLMKNVVYVP